MSTLNTNAADAAKPNVNTPGAGIPNRLINETSPYLLDHAFNPVNWFPWGDDAFEKAKAEDKPVFLSIGYSTCHWCHVMEKESFDDKEVAAILNENFVSIKVDREERPDIDSVYMSVCQALTGSGGWPLTIIMTPQQKPFFAGTYFPKHDNYGRIGLIQLLENIKTAWKENRQAVEQDSKTIVKALARPSNKEPDGNNSSKEKERIKEQTKHPEKHPEKELAEKKSAANAVNEAYHYLSQSFDNFYGGFSNAPKFPTPHNILFLLDYYKITNDKKSLMMAEKTLLAMYKGGIFDHIGYGFSRYSTDRFWLVPHFEKMLYDNALLLSAYVKAYEITKNNLYKSVAEKIIKYVKRDLSNGNAFYSAQDADIMGEEGKFYTFSTKEITDLLGNDSGGAFNKAFGITKEGNFEGKNIPNLIANENANSLSFNNIFPSDASSVSVSRAGISAISQQNLEKLYEFRKNRYELKTDDKILTSWNCLMIAALSQAYIAFDNRDYLNAALSAFDFINKNLKSGGDLFASFRQDKRSQSGFLDDYVFYTHACIWLYKATLEQSYIDSALETTKKTDKDFSARGGGYCLSPESAKLIFRPVETYDGAMPSANSVMVYNLVFLAAYTEDAQLQKEYIKQIDFMLNETSTHYGANSFFALSCLLSGNLSKAVCVLDGTQSYSVKAQQFKTFDVSKILKKPDGKYPLKDGKTTFYVCKSNSCLPPQNNLPEL